MKNLHVHLFVLTILALTSINIIFTPQFEAAMTSGFMYASADNHRVSGSGTIYPAAGLKADVSVDIMLSSAGNSYFYYSYNYSPDTETKVEFASTSITGIKLNNNTVKVTGTGTVNGSGGYTFTATLSDNNSDTLSLEIRKPDGRLYYRIEPKPLIEGNFTISVQ